MDLTMTITEVNVLHGGEKSEQVPTSGGMIVVSYPFGILEIKAVSDSDDQLRFTEDVQLLQKDSNGAFTGAFEGELPYKIGDTLKVGVTHGN